MKTVNKLHDLINESWKNVENIIKALDANEDLNKSYNSCVPCSGIDRSRYSHRINQLTIRRGL